MASVKINRCNLPLLFKIVTTVHSILSLRCGEQKRQNPSVRYWEMITDNLSKAGWTRVMSQPWTLAGERF